MCSSDLAPPERSPDASASQTAVGRPGRKPVRKGSSTGMLVFQGLLVGVGVGFILLMLLAAVLLLGRFI